MIKVSVLYPKTKSSAFDMDYYCNSHIPMVREKCGKKKKNTCTSIPLKNFSHHLARMPKQ